MKSTLISHIYIVFYFLVNVHLISSSHMQCFRSVLIKCSLLCFIWSEDHFESRSCFLRCLEVLPSLLPTVTHKFSSCILFHHPYPNCTLNAETRYTRSSNEIPLEINSFCVITQVSDTFCVSFFKERNFSCTYELNFLLSPVSF